jgi:hypothetical protein
MGESEMTEQPEQKKCCRNCAWFWLPNECVENDEVDTIFNADTFSCEDHVFVDDDYDEAYEGGRKN